MKRIALIGGTRPEAIKLAPLYHELRRRTDIEALFISTGQHRQMLDNTLACFGIRPDLDLNLMQERQTLPELTGRVVTGVSAALQQLKPDAVIVQGDTATALGAALAAFYERVPIGHVEAGLRTYNLLAPWPEEMNRRLISPIARWNFAPTAAAAENLLSERVARESILVTGNTVIDALLWMRDRQAALALDPIARAVGCGVESAFAERVFSAETGSKWILVTGHRRESFGAGMEALCRALLALVEENPSLSVVYPVHLNPNVREPVNRLLCAHPRIALIEPLGYEDFVWFMARCLFIITDSGGVQEEAPSLGKPVLVTRETTERPEAVEAGVSVLVGTSPERILKECRLLLGSGETLAKRAALVNPYGDGKASSRIVDRLLRDLGVPVLG